MVLLLYSEQSSHRRCRFLRMSARNIKKTSLIWIILLLNSHREQVTVNWAATTKLAHKQANVIITMCAIYSSNNVKASVHREDDATRLLTHAYIIPVFLHRQVRIFIRLLTCSAVCSWAERHRSLGKVTQGEPAYHVARRWLPKVHRDGENTPREEAWTWSTFGCYLGGTLDVICLDKLQQWKCPVHLGYASSARFANVLQHGATAFIYFCLFLN